MDNPTGKVAREKNRQINRKMIGLTSTTTVVGSIAQEVQEKNN